jgi:hypothetical protein
LREGEDARQGRLRDNRQVDPLNDMLRLAVEPIEKVRTSRARRSRSGPYMKL